MPAFFLFYLHTSSCIYKKDGAYEKKGHNHICET